LYRRRQTCRLDFGSAVADNLQRRQRTRLQRQTQTLKRKTFLRLNVSHTVLQRCGPLSVDSARRLKKNLRLFWCLRRKRWLRRVTQSRALYLNHKSLRGSSLNNKNISN
jgi:hypothetical protein